MKKLVALTLLVAGTSALADSSRSIYDLMYLPKGGTAYGITDARYADWKIESHQHTKVDYDEYGANQTLGYALTDMFSLSARIGYTHIKFDGNGDGKFDGITDPVINGRLRLMDGDYRLDLLAEGLVSLGDNKIKSNGDGNVLTGGHQLAAGAQLGQKQTDWQWSVTGLVRRYFEATTDDKSTGVETKDDAHFGLDLAADVLAHLSDESNIRAYVAANSQQEYDDDQDGTTAFQKMYTFGLEYQYLVSNDLMIRGGINYRWIRTDSIKQWDAFTPNIAANYQF